MSCVLHILDADGSLTPWLSRIDNAFTRASALVASRLPVGPVDVIVHHDPEQVVPELGMSGFCTSPRRLYLPLDVGNPGLSASFETIFQAFLAHELHHCARRCAPGFADTLGQALVSEGLACCFEAELPGGGVPPYASRLSGRALDAIRARAAAEMDRPLSGWGRWFFGEAEPEIPIHAGYALGFEIVSRWLRRQALTAAEAYAVPAARILAATVPAPPNTVA